VDDVESGRRNVIAPDQIDQLRRADRLALAGQEQGEQVRLLPGARVHLDAVPPEPQRSEYLATHRMAGGCHARSTPGLITQIADGVR
jgi:hypothetical protein